MTIIVAYQQTPGGPVWLGSDGRVTMGGYVASDRKRKWHAAHGRAIATCGPERACAIVEAYAGEILAHETPFLIGEEIRRRFEAASVKATDGGSYEFNAIAVARVRGQTTIIDYDGALAPTLGAPFVAAGSGQEYARGAIYALEAQGVCEPQLIVRAAVAAACRGDLRCGGAVYIAEHTADGALREEPAHAQIIFRGAGLRPKPGLYSTDCGMEWR